MGRNNNNRGKGASSNKSAYAAAGNLLTQILEEKKSFKKLVYSKEGTLTCSKTTYAQVCQVLTHKNVLDQVLKKVPSLSKDVRNSGLLHVLVYELLLGPNKKIKGGGAVKRKIMQHAPALNKALESKEIARQLAEMEAPHKFPRYARVNTLLTSLKKVCDCLKEAKEAEEACVEFYVDAHIPDLLVFPTSIITQIMGKDATKLTKQQENIKQMIEHGKLILQDKSSCLSALCLAHGFVHTSKDKTDFIDACAAPGNKTQHLAALVGGSTETKTTINAFDRSEERLKSMAKRMQQLAPSGDSVQVAPQTQDFLKTKPREYPKVGGILLDPSCSGSGIYTAPDRWTEDSTPDESRIESLANFQEVALRHAMSFSNVSKIVYSTCSLHDRENEMVVQKALESNGEEWKVVAPRCLTHWKRRGRVVEGVSQEEADCMIRACDQDETNGFFVCCFERKTTRASKERSPWKKITPPKGMTIYSGQFLDKKPAKEEKGESKPSSDEASTDKPAKKGKPGKASKSEPKGKEPANDESEAVEKPDKIYRKKIAKKLAWKKRQMEQKQERLQKKKLKTEAKEEAE